MLSCQKCGAELLDPTLCEQCGWHEAALVVVSSVVAICPVDSAPLAADGFCPRGRGYPHGRACRFACPFCRGPLEWDGRCDVCHGCTTGERLDWTFPGDRYDLFDDKGQPIRDGRHWVKTDGPRAACTPEQNLAGIREIQRILTKSALLAPLDRPRRARRTP